MELPIKENGKKVELKAMENLLILMMIHIKVSGKMIKLMDGGFSKD